MRPHVLRCQPAFRFPGLPALGKFVHQPDSGLCPLVVLHIHDGIPAPAILGQKHRSAHRYIMQNRMQSLRMRLVQWMAAKGQFWAVRMYYRLVFKFVYGILFK